MISRPAMPKKRWLRVTVISLLVGLALFVGGAVIVRQVYYQNLKPVSVSQKVVTITIPLGSSLDQIANILNENHLIKSKWAFKQYVRSKDADGDIKAGTYELSSGYSAQEIVSIITEGKIKTNLVTILPGQTIKQIKKTFITHGFLESAVEAAFKPSLYKNHPALVDKPVAADLEGYLYPESYQKSDNTKPEEIVTLALDEMQNRLTPELRKALAKQDLSVYEGIILASESKLSVSLRSALAAP